VSGPPFAILRFERIPNAGSLAASAAHMCRTNPTPNADPARASLNRIVIGTADPAADLRRRREDVHLRTNSGWGVEVLLTASPGWWRTASAEQQREWEARTVRWLEAEFGREHIAHLRWHRDERSPHLTGYVIPTKPRPVKAAGNGGPSRSYSAEAIFGGKAKCSALQDRYAAAVADLGLARGVRGSEAEHTSIAAYYQALRGAEVVEPPVVPVPPLALTNGSREAWAVEQSERVAAATRDLAVRARDAGAAKKRAGEMAASAARIAGERDDARRISDQVRDVPLDWVLDRWGLERDPADRKQWRARPDDGGAAARRVTVQGGKWFDHAASKGGGGAIDLVCHLGRMKPGEAIGWLAREHGVDGTARAIAAKAVQDAPKIAADAAAAASPELPLPPDRAPSEARWTFVRSYLIGHRRLPAELVDAEHAAGRLWADRRGSVVWPLTDADGRRVGYEWRVARAKRQGEAYVPRGVVPGSRSGAGAYDLPAADPTSDEVLVVEGALDALAARAIGAQGRIIGVAGTSAGRGLLRELGARLGAAVRWVLGYDRDPAGEAAAQEVAAHLPRPFRRRAPGGAHDWGEALQRSSSSITKTATNSAFDRAPEAPPQQNSAGLRPGG
jgi:hypothetical protein